MSPRVRVRVRVVCRPLMVQYCFHEGAKIYKVIYALWRGGSAVEELATTEDSDSLGSDPSSPRPDPVPYPRSVSDPHPPSISEVPFLVIYLIFYLIF